ncbi:ThiF family adenylyltransferase [Paenibacillus sp. BR2-3]|uniref:ThiF family adenylyltransferase n=1 Tax=Paenibacillus sp. BR2-3 TaxID=3048494 RepID=UPI00397761C5
MLRAHSHLLQFWVTMEDQLSLSEYYDGVIEVVSLHLIKHYEAQIVKVDDVRRFARSFHLRKNGQAIVLSIPYLFPDVFPTVHVPQSYFSRLYPIPHLDITRNLCCFDPEEAHPNAENPLGVIDEVINRAFSLIEAGIRRENMTDYLDEFDSYWGQHTNGTILSMIDLTNSLKEVELIDFIHPTFGAGTIAVDSILEGIKWLKNIGSVAEPANKKALYLPLKSLGTPPYPNTNGELIKRLRQFDPELINPLFQFMNKHTRPTSIMFSITTTKGQILGIWEHQMPRQTAPSAYIKKRKKQKAVDGFRKGMTNARMELNFFRQVPLVKYSVIRVDKERIMHRGGDGEVKPQEKVALLGCGSIGSHIAQSLSDMGITELLLVDKDKLSFENIARHLCGAIDVGKNKVDAVSQHLTSRLPHSRHAIYNEDILKILRDYQSILNQYELVIVAVGNLPIELRLNDLQKKGIIHKPILYVWVEPFLAGGHALYVNPNNEGCLRCLFDRDHIFKQNILINPGQYAIREAGCQSTYFPYSVVEVKRFINDLMYFVEDINSEKINQNILFTWLGDLSKQRNNGRKISSRWGLANDYTTRRVPLSEFQRCEGCQS